MPRGICDVSLEYTHIYFRDDLFPGYLATGRRPAPRALFGAPPHAPSAFYSRGAAPHPVLISGRCPVPRPLS